MVQTTVLFVNFKILSFAKTYVGMVTTVSQVNLVNAAIITLKYILKSGTSTSVSTQNVLNKFKFF